MKIFRLALVLSVILLYSCEKEKDPTKSEILAQKPWKLTSSTINPPLNIPEIGIISDYYAFLPPCKKDDIWVFKTNGSFTFEEGDTKCDELSPTVYDMGNWTLNSDETVLSLTSLNSGMSEYDIVELTSSVMKLRFQLVDTLSNVYTVNESYGH
jgi:hypothetical protein